MKIMVAPDSFKGSLTALAVAENIEKGIKQVLPEAEVKKLPMADGGEGTVQSLVDATGGEIIEKEVTGPLGERVKAKYGLLGDGETAVIEMAAASGLPLVPEGKKDPTRTTTYGTGELIKSALDKGAQKLIVGIGGSATNDCGAGMAQALGVKFLDSNGQEIGYGGGQLDKVTEIRMGKLDARISEVEIKVACDVNNPLYGPNGAAHVYGPQKGATPEMVKLLDANLKHMARIIKKELEVDVQSIPGAGAAGGLGAGLVAFLGAELQSGVDIVLETTDFETKIKDVDLVITGEGMLDVQTVQGKTPIGVARKAKKYKLPVIAIAGTIGSGVEKVLDEGIDVYFSITQQPLDLKNALNHTEKWLQETAAQVMRVYQLGGGKRQ